MKTPPIKEPNTLLNAIKIKVTAALTYLDCTAMCQSNLQPTCKTETWRETPSVFQIITQWFHPDSPQITSAPHLQVYTHKVLQQTYKTTVKGQKPQQHWQHLRPCLKEDVNEDSPGNGQCPWVGGGGKIKHVSVGKSFLATSWFYPVFEWNSLITHPGGLTQARKISHCFWTSVSY